jgi:hypothetical protein
VSAVSGTEGSGAAARLIATELVLAGLPRSEALSRLLRFGFEERAAEEAIATAYPASVPAERDGPLRRLLGRETKIEFYSLKHRRKVKVDVRHVHKRIYQRETANGSRVFYGLVARASIEGDEVTLSRFISEEHYDRL